MSTLDMQGVGGALPVVAATAPGPFQPSGDHPQDASPGTSAIVSTPEPGNALDALTAACGGNASVAQQIVGTLPGGT